MDDLLLLLARMKRVSLVARIQLRKQFRNLADISKVMSLVGAAGAASLGACAYCVLLRDAAPIVTVATSTAVFGSYLGLACWALFFDNDQHLQLTRESVERRIGYLADQLAQRKREGQRRWRGNRRHPTAGILVSGREHCQVHEPGEGRASMMSTCDRTRPRALSSR